MDPYCVKHKAMNLRLRTQISHFASIYLFLSWLIVVTVISPDQDNSCPSLVQIAFTWILFWKQRQLLAFKETNQNTQEVKMKHYLIRTRQNNVAILGKFYLQHIDVWTNRYKTWCGKNLSGCHLWSCFETLPSSQRSSLEMTRVRRKWRSKDEYDVDFFIFFIYDE